MLTITNIEYSVSLLSGRQQLCMTVQNSQGVQVQVPITEEQANKIEAVVQQVQAQPVQNQQFLHNQRFIPPEQRSPTNRGAAVGGALASYTQAAPQENPAQPVQQHSSGAPYSLGALAAAARGQQVSSGVQAVAGFMQQDTQTQQAAPAQTPEEEAHIEQALRRLLEENNVDASALSQDDLQKLRSHIRSQMGSPAPSGGDEDGVLSI